ncbi:unknown [Fusobacterium sp. CAG:439]|nr:unknown [Fusobacterium sp. CAG:439]HIT91481.1 hypothetical protein [Candidatus Stercorousia faecigallinarum]
MNGIEAVQPNNIFRVNAVNLFDNNRQDKAVQRFNTGLFAQQTNENYNLNHPRVVGSETQARHLDLLA